MNERPILFSEPMVKAIRAGNSYRNRILNQKAMIKTAIECLSESTCEPVEELEKCREVQIVRPSEAIEAIESYHAQFEAFKPVIHAKALIQKGTGFCWSKTAGIWNLSYDIIPYTVECNDVPEDAELVDIEIIVKGGEK